MVCYLMGYSVCDSASFLSQVSHLFWFFCSQKNRQWRIGWRKAFAYNYFNTKTAGRRLNRAIVASRAGRTPDCWFLVLFFALMMFEHTIFRVGLHGVEITLFFEFDKLVAQEFNVAIGGEN